MPWPRLGGGSCAGLAGWLRGGGPTSREWGKLRPRPGAGPLWAEAGWLSAAAAAGEDGGGCSPACMDGGAAAERAAAQEGHYQVSAGSRFRFGTRGTWAAGPGRPRAASPPRRCPTSRIPQCPRPRLLRPVLARPERPAWAPTFPPLGPPLLLRGSALFPGAGEPSAALDFNLSWDLCGPRTERKEPEIVVSEAGARNRECGVPGRSAGRWEMGGLWRCGESCVHLTCLTIY